MDSSEEDVWANTDEEDEKKPTEKVMTDDDDDDDDDDEDNVGVIDDDVLTPYQVHSAPVSSQQAAELTYKMFSAPNMWCVQQGFF